MAVFNDEEVIHLVMRLAHIIRTPLSTIKGGVQLVQIINKPEGEAADYLDSAVHEVDRIDEIMGDLLNYIRLGIPEKQVVDVAAVASEVVLEQSGPAHCQGVTVKAHEGPTEATVDAAHLQLALSELVNNAVRACDSGGTVMLSCSAAEGWLTVTVDDDGPGVSSLVEPRLMDPFFTTSPGGTGLGLNIAAKSASLSGGRLEWCNRPEGGARFSLYLPIDESSEVGTASPAT